MRSNLTCTLFFGLLFTLSFSACTPDRPRAVDGEFLIGDKLTDVTSPNDEFGNPVSRIAIFDRTVNRIHQFNLQTIQHERSVAVEHPGIDHTVLYGADANFLVDLTNKSVRIFNQNSERSEDPFRFSGVPKSAAFLPSKRLLLVYDSFNSIGLLKMNADGSVADSWVGGPAMCGNKEVAAGDFDDNGRLILVLTDDTVALVDVDQTLAQKRCVFTSYASTIAGIKWVGPVSGSPDRVLVSSSTKMAILDVAAQTVVKDWAFGDDWELKKFSKTTDPHIYLKSRSSSYASGEVKIAYVTGNDIQTITLIDQMHIVLKSRLNLASQTLTVVDAKTFPDKDVELRQYQLDNGRRVNYSEKIANGVKAEIFGNGVFELHPNKVGYALYRNVVDKTVKEFPRGFNLDYL